MTNISKFVVGAIGVLVLAVVAYSALRSSLLPAVSSGLHEVGETTPIRYQQTLIFEVGGSQVRASGVYEVELAFRNSAARGRGVEVKLLGDAIPIDLGDDGMLFALVGYPHDVGQSPTVIADACGDPPLPSSRSEEELVAWIAEVARFDAPCEVPRASWPLLVSFTDLARPETIQRVSPEQIPGLTGDRVRLARVIIAPSGDPIGTKIGEYLPWLGKPLPSSLDIDAVEPSTSPILIDELDFKRRPPQ